MRPDAIRRAAAPALLALRLQAEPNVPPPPPLVHDGVPADLRELDRRLVFHLAAIDAIIPERTDHDPAD